MLPVLIASEKLGLGSKLVSWCAARLYKTKTENYCSAGILPAFDIKIKCATAYLYAKAHQQMKQPQVFIF